MERRGAPVAAFAGIDERPIALGTSVEEPAVVVVLEHHLRRTVPVTRGLKPGGLLLVNGPYHADTKEGPGPRHRAVVDAPRIALRHDHAPDGNTPMLGALARVTGAVSVRPLEVAIEECAPARGPGRPRPRSRRASAASPSAGRTSWASCLPTGRSTRRRSLRPSPRTLSPRSRARDLVGPRFLDVLKPCPPGWQFSSERTIEIGRWAADCGVFPLYEVLEGKLRITRRLGTLMPLAEYLRAQGRFQHLTDPEMEALETEVRAEWEALRAREDPEFRPARGAPVPRTVAVPA